MTHSSLPWPIQRIIEVANTLNQTGRTAASTGEQIAAAFVLNQMEYLPGGYTDVIDAWDRLDDWQGYVRRIKQDYMHLVEEVNKEEGG